MLTADFAFDLPDERIAAEPAEPRDSARLLVLRRDGGLEHRRFRDLPEFLRPGDALALNRTKVFPARLRGRKPTGGAAELLLVAPLNGAEWLALSREGRAGLEVRLEGGAGARFLERTPSGEWRVEFSSPDIWAFAEAHGEMPLPPYILKSRPDRKIRAEDRERYQTVFAADRGSIAAPTAALHFTPELLARLRSSGVEVVELTMHIGWGTFRPITADKVEDHRMLPETFEVGAKAAEALSRARASGGRIVSVGTSCTRALESLPALREGRGASDLFIAPGHRFRHVDALVTNFHLPASTPLMLTCAFAGREKIREAYREAIDLGYRFYSYGDACLIL